MLVRYLTTLVGGDFIRDPGDTESLADDVAGRYLEAGIVEPVIESPEIETADGTPTVPEVATVEPKVRRKGRSW